MALSPMHNLRLMDAMSLGPTMGSDFSDPTGSQHVPVADGTDPFFDTQFPKTLEESLSENGIADTMDMGGMGAAHIVAAELRGILYVILKGSIDMHESPYSTKGTGLNLLDPDVAADPLWMHEHPAHARAHLAGPLSEPDYRSIDYFMDPSPRESRVSEYLQHGESGHRLMHELTDANRRAIANLTPELRGLSNFPFNPLSSDGSRLQDAKAAARKVLTDDRYLALEAGVVVTAHNDYCGRPESYIGNLDKALGAVASTGYDAHVAPTLANAISTLAYSFGMVRVLGADPSMATADMRRAVSTEIDRVGLCPAQMDETMRSVKLKDTYVNGVRKAAGSLPK